ncbi:MAG: c-type cytochrome [Leptospiraceae bacterium]|nr:c-type cytochrome [Leptospiraceae bacterium]MDW7976995.1 c-type cytochrome [Leptospiraceae bacterium]
MFNEYRDDDYEVTDKTGWLPVWWMMILYGTVAFSIVYIIYMHGIAGWSQEQQYEEEVALYKKLHPEVVAQLNDDGSNPLRGDSKAIAEGEKIYQQYCAACHKPDLSGIVGPNLKDNQWLHAENGVMTDKIVYNLIMEGISENQIKQNPPKGPMPAHKNSLGSAKILQVMAFLAAQNPSLQPK